MGDEIKEEEMGVACEMYGGKRNASWVLVGWPPGRRPLAVLGHRWEDNIKIDLVDVEVEWTGFMWISMFHHAFFNSIIDKTPTHALFNQQCINPACWFY